MRWLFSERLSACMLACCMAVPAAAPAAPPALARMDAIVVSGTQPGPGLWKVSKSGHVLWVLGTLSPLPRRMQWKARDVDAAIASAQAVLAAPQVGITSKLGFFGKIALLPSLIGLRNNPDGALLKDVVPADLYARWAPLKNTYIGRGGKVEKWRPLFAALDLYAAAIDKAGLSDDDVVGKTIKTDARRARIEETPIQVTIAVDDLKGAVKEFKQASVDDLDCFSKTLDRIDGDLGNMVARANAWASGDLEALRALPYTDQMAACRAAITGTQLARIRGVTDIDARVQQAWVDAASAALSTNNVTFARLPIRHLLASDNYLEQLRAQGCTVEAPDAAEAGDDAATAASAP